MGGEEVAVKVFYRSNPETTTTSPDSGTSTLSSLLSDQNTNSTSSSRNKDNANSQSKSSTDQNLDQDNTDELIDQSSDKEEDVSDYQNVESFLRPSRNSTTSSQYSDGPTVSIDETEQKVVYRDSLYHARTSALLNPLSELTARVSGSVYGNFNQVTSINSSVRDYFEGRSMKVMIFFIQLMYIIIIMIRVFE